MKCIFCGHSDSKVVDSRYLKDGSIRRRRECMDCGKRFTTYETAETNPLVVTNVDNVREPFKMEKLLESIKYAIYCTRIEGTEADIADKIEKRLLGLQQQEITTEDIVRVALNILSELDSMASVVYYTQHTSCDDFDGIRKFINR